MENRIQAISYCTGTVIDFYFFKGKITSIRSSNFNTGKEDFHASITPKDGQILLTREIFDKAATVFCYDHHLNNYKEIFELLKNDTEYLELFKIVMARENLKMSEQVKIMTECLKEII